MIDITEKINLIGGMSGIVIRLNVQINAVAIYCTEICFK